MINNQYNLIKEKDLDNNLYEDYQEYFIIKDKKNLKIFKIIILKTKENIIIKCRKYEIQLNMFDFANLTKSSFDLIEKAYDFIIDLFEENKVIVKDMSTNDNIKLIFKVNKKKEFEIILKYNKLNRDNILDELNKLKKEINSLKEEIFILTKDKESTINHKENDNKENNKNQNEIGKNEEKKKKRKKTVEYKSNAINIRHPNYLEKNIITRFVADNAICVFNSINNILYLIYSKNNSIISYDLVNKKITTEIKNAHNKNDIRFRHYLDRINKRDLFLSISIEQNELKLWNVNNWEYILYIPKVNELGKLFSACFLNDYDKIYIITTNHNIDVIPELIKVFDLEGNKITEINDSSDKTFFIDKYYDQNLSKYFLLTGNNGGVKSYDYYENKLYREYSDKEKKSIYDNHFSLIINDCEEKFSYS